MTEKIKELIVKQNNNLEHGFYCEVLDYQMELLRKTNADEFNEAMNWAIENPELTCVL